MRVWHPPMHEQPEEMRHKQPLIVKSQITDEKFQTFEFKASTFAPWCEQQTVAGTQQSPVPYNMQQTSQRAGQQMSVKSLQHRWKHEIESASFDEERSPLVGVACSLMHRHVLELEALFEDHGVCSGVITDSFALERMLHEQRALAQPLLQPYSWPMRERVSISCSLLPVLSCFTLVKLHWKSLTRHILGLAVVLT